MHPGPQMQGYLDGLDINLRKGWSSFYVRIESNKSPLRYAVKDEYVLLQKSHFFCNMVFKSSPVQHAVIPDRYAAALSLLVTWLQVGYSDNLLVAGERAYCPEKEDRWLTIIIHLCALCEKWKIPIVFNQAIDHFTFLQKFPPMNPEHIRTIYQSTNIGSSLRRLVVDIIAGEGGALLEKGHLRYFVLATHEMEFMADMWERLILPRSALFDGNGTVMLDHLVGYHMQV